MAERMKIKFETDVKIMNISRVSLQSSNVQQQLNIEELKHADDDLRFWQSESQKKVREWDFDFQGICAELEHLQELEQEAEERLNTLNKKMPERVKAEQSDFLSRKKEIQIRIYA